MRKKFGLFPFIQCGYLILPVIIFLVGWLKLWIGIPCGLILMWCWWRYSSAQTSIGIPQLEKKSIVTLVLVLIIALIWTYLSGIGKFVYQNGDHDCRNAIFDLLVERDWPVVFSAEETMLGSSTMLVYYIGFWMPAALVGKIAGINAGYIFQYIWAVVGIMIFYVTLSSVLKKYSIWPLIAFIFFSGLDIIGSFITQEVPDCTLAEFFTAHLEQWARYQFSSMTTQLYWVFNQALPAWIAVLMLKNQKRNRFCVMILGITMLSSAFGFIGLLPFAALWVLTRKYEDDVKSKVFTREWFKDTFSPENILGGGISGLITFAYFSNNTSGQSIVFGIRGSGFRGIAGLIVFLILDMALYALLVFRYQRKSPTYYVVVGWLCVCPLIGIGAHGGGYDFCMRASIPALVLLFVYVVQALEQMKLQKRKLSMIALIVVMLIGAVTPFDEIYRAVYKTAEAYRSENGLVFERAADTIINSDANFSGPTDSFFYNTLVRKN